MVTDRVNRHPKPLAGNQLAAALSKAGVVQNDVPVEPRGRVVQPKARVVLPASWQFDEKIVLPELRDYLARLVAGARLPKAEMGVSLADWQCGEINRRLKARGLLDIKMGHYGGAMATPRLVELARTNITDAELRRLTLTEVPDDEVVQAEAPTIPASSIENRQAIVRNIYAWLRRGMDGQQLRISHIGHGDGGAIHTAVARIRDAGLVEKVGEGANSYHLVPKDQHDRILALTNEDLLAILWRKAPHVKPEMSSDTATGEDLASTIVREFAVPMQPQESEPSLPPDDILGVVAQRFTQIVDVLVRMDARFARLERELGLKPIEEEIES